jgi:uncharacterized protein (DUF1778 family)
MTKQAKKTETKAPKKTTAKAGRTSPEPKPEKAEPEELVVFAFRLTPTERDLIHRAAGAAKASRFVRTLTVAAARGDAATIQSLLEARAVTIS